MKYVTVAGAVQYIKGTGLLLLRSMWEPPVFLLDCRKVAGRNLEMKEKLDLKTTSRGNDSYE